MLTGGYGNNKFFSTNTRDLFISPQSSDTINYGIGWWREADNRRVWYFGTQSPESTIGHQGWTGTLTMIDFENNMVIVYLTNTINTPIVNPTSLENANDFAGRYYTASTLGFVPQIIYAGMDNLANPKTAFKSLIKDMVVEKQKLIDEMTENTGKEVTDHPILEAKKSLEKVADRWR
jgi:CubicO group peptidase (beta-lactamase class C family)